MDSKKSLNPESFFYYGFAMKKNPKSLDVQSNMPSFQEKPNLLERWRRRKKENAYWFSAQDKNYSLYTLFKPSEQMLKDGAWPMLHCVSHGSASLRKKPQKGILGPLGSNLGIALRLRGIAKGVHRVSFQFLLGDRKKKDILEEFKTLDQWKMRLRYFSPHLGQLKGS